MVKRINTAYELQKIFQDYDRDCFSLLGYEALLEYYDEIDENTELDVIGICSAFTEYDNDDFISDFGYLYPAADFLYDNNYIDAEELSMEIDEEYKDEYIQALAKILEQNTYVFHLDNDNYLVMK